MTRNGVIFLSHVFRSTFWQRIDQLLLPNRQLSIRKERTHVVANTLEQLKQQKTCCWIWRTTGVFKRRPRLYLVNAIVMASPEASRVRSVL